MYAVWDVARTDEMRPQTHRGAWCNPCLKYGVKKDPKGHFFAQIDAILTHVKDCPRRSAAIKQSAAAELRVIRDKKKKGPLAGVKRTGSTMSGASSDASTGSNKRSALAAVGFMTLEDKPLGDNEQVAWEQQLLKGTVSANLPLSTNIQTKRRNKFVLARLEKLAQIKATLLPKPRPVSKQPAGNQYLSSRSAARDAETSNAELAAVTRQNDSEYIDGADDLMVTGEQVTEVMAEYHMQLSEDAKDDADFQSNPDNTPLAELFVGMPEFDVDLLFDEVSA
ncbi:TPA: hypothetical protein ACH3X1_004920 [Trebouxia sp. C0004]